jgi:NCAIR mutase (PurE)-related protein
MYPFFLFTKVFSIMDNSAMMSLLTELYNKNISVDQALSQLKDLPYQDLGFAKVDHHRALRKGYPEVIFCQSKTPEHVVKISQAQISHGESVFGTRANNETLDAVKEAINGVEIDTLARCFWHKSAKWKMQEKTRGKILLCAAGTADLSVAQEAQRTLEIIGHPYEMITDVGVAGIHRLFAHREKINEASVIICVAGMEGALPSVVTGLASCPVIGVPTSVGYGSHLNGMVPLLAMLNSCASGLTVVNIDNGFGAACAAAAINSNQ